MTASWAITSNANKSKLDKVQNVALRAIVLAMRTTPIKEVEKRADLEPLELRRTFIVFTETEKIRRLPCDPLHKSWLLQPKIGYKDRASTTWPRTSGELTLLYFCLTLIPRRASREERHLSAARRNAWAGGMLYRDSVSLTPLIQSSRTFLLLCGH